MAGFPAANLLADVGGSPVPPAVLSTAFGVGSPTCELVPGTELRQAGSHTGLLRDAGDPARTVFLKKVTASLVASKAWNDRRRVLLYIRNELRFYNEFADGLRRNGVGIPLVQHAAGENLDGIEDYEEEPPAARLERCGALLFMEPFAEASRYVQQSPLSLSQARRLLAAAARLHAAAWEETEVLGRAAERLQRHGGSFALSARNPKELRELTASWSRFMSAFDSGAPAGFFARPEIAALGSRLQAAAPWTSAQLSPAPGDRFATLVHGDLKAMNVFLPAAPAEVDSLPSCATAAEGVVLIDFASTGVGFGMADVAMHLVHALMPADLEGGGEEALINGYLDALAAARGAAASPYPREQALRHFRLATCDYGRFVMGRFWSSATPERFEAAAHSPNVVLANRNLASALRFVERIHACLAEFEAEMGAEILSEVRAVPTTSDGATLKPP